MMDVASAGTSWPVCREKNNIGWENLQEVQANTMHGRIVMVVVVSMRANQRTPTFSCATI